MRTDQPLCWQRYVLGDDKAAEALKLWCWCEAKEPAMAPLGRGDLRIQGRGKAGGG